MQAVMPQVVTLQYMFKSATAKGGAFPTGIRALAPCEHAARLLPSAQHRNIHGTPTQLQRKQPCTARHLSQTFACPRSKTLTTRWIAGRILMVREKNCRALDTRTEAASLAESRRLDIMGEVRGGVPERVKLGGGGGNAEESHENVAAP